MCLSKKICKLLIDLVEYEICHVWREANQPADILASLANGSNEQILYSTDFPSYLKEIQSFFVINAIIYLPKKIFFSITIILQ